MSIDSQFVSFANNNKTLFFENNQNHLTQKSTRLDDSGKFRQGFAEANKGARALAAKFEFLSRKVTALLQKPSSVGIAKEQIRQHHLVKIITGLSIATLMFAVWRGASLWSSSANPKVVSGIKGSYTENFETPSPTLTQSSAPTLTQPSAPTLTQSPSPTLTQSPSLTLTQPSAPDLDSLNVTHSRVSLDSLDSDSILACSNSGNSTLGGIEIERKLDILRMKFRQLTTDSESFEMKTLAKTVKEYKQEQISSLFANIPHSRTASLLSEAFKEEDVIQLVYENKLVGKPLGLLPDSIKKNLNFTGLTLDQKQQIYNSPFVGFGGFRTVKIDDLNADLESGAFKLYGDYLAFYLFSDEQIKEMKVEHFSRNQFFTLFFHEKKLKILSVDQLKAARDAGLIFDDEIQNHATEEQKALLKKMEAKEAEILLESLKKKEQAELFELGKKVGEVTQGQCFSPFEINLNASLTQFTAPNLDSLNGTHSHVALDLLDSDSILPRSNSENSTVGVIDVEEKELANLRMKLRQPVRTFEDFKEMKIIGKNLKKYTQEQISNIFDDISLDDKKYRLTLFKEEDVIQMVYDHKLVGNLLGLLPDNVKKKLDFKKLNLEQKKQTYNAMYTLERNKQIYHGWCSDCGGFKTVDIADLNAELESGAFKQYGDHMKAYMFSDEQIKEMKVEYFTPKQFSELFIVDKKIELLSIDQLRAANNAKLISSEEIQQYATEEQNKALGRGLTMNLFPLGAFAIYLCYQYRR